MFFGLRTNFSQKSAVILRLSENIFRPPYQSFYGRNFTLNQKKRYGCIITNPTCPGYPALPSVKKNDTQIFPSYCFNKKGIRHVLKWIGIYDNKDKPDDDCTGNPQPPPF